MKYDDKDYKKSRRKNWTYVVLGIFLIFTVAGGYAIYQYNQGVSQSKEKGIEPAEYEFNGEKDLHSRTNVLFLGSDAREEEGSRADTIMIGSYQPDRGEYKLVSIMRDTYVEIPGHEKNRINAAFALGGPELLRETIKQNFDIDLRYYAIVNFEGFVHLIDEAFPKGVKVNVEKRMSENIGVDIEPGLQNLDGEHLLGYVRFRHDAIGDFGRVERQQKVVRQISDQLTSLDMIPKLPKLLGVVTPYINTNMNTGDILFIGKDFLSTGNRQIDTLTIPVDGSWENMIVEQKDVLSIDLEQNKTALHEFLGE